MVASTLVDLVKIAINSTGTGTLTLGSALTAFRGTEALTDGATYSYSIQQFGNYEIGTGVYSATPSTLTRGIQHSSNGGTAIDLSANAVLTVTVLTTDYAAINNAAIAAINAAAATAISSIDADGATQVGNVNAAGAAQVSNVNTAGATQIAAINAAATAAQTAAINAITTAQAVAIAAVNAAGATQIAAIPNITDIQNAGGRKNLWPDPFHLELNVVANGGFRSGLASAYTPFTFGAAVPTWGYTNASTASPYPDGKMLVRPGGNVATPTIELYFDRIGLVPGDTIEFSQEMAYQTSGNSTSGQVGTYEFRNGAGAIIGSAVNLFSLSSGAGALTTTPKRFTTGAVTIPAGARYLKLNYTLWGGNAIEIYSTWIHKGSTLTKPVDRLAPPDEYGRFKALEAADPTANNILLKQFTYSALTLAIGPSGGALNTFSANNGMGSNYITASIPAGGFNAIQEIFNWGSTATGPSRIYVQVRTAAAGSLALNGTLIAEGWIGTDPNALTSGLQSVLLYDVVTGLPRTIQAADADMLARYSVYYFGVKADGSFASQVFVDYATASDGDTTFPGYYLMGTPVGQGMCTVLDAGTGKYCAAKRVLLTNPAPAYVPSPTFSGLVAANLDPVPALDMLPQRIWNVVGMETWVYYAGMQHRPPSRTNFYSNYTFAGSYPSNPSGTFEEGVCIKETAASTKTLTVNASIGSTLYSTKSTSVKTIANTSGAGSSFRVLGLGSSLMQNAGLQSNMLTLVADTSINPGGAATGMNIVNVGTVGTAPNQTEGRSGQSIGIYFTPGDVFYNPGTSTFDFAYYVTNSLAGVPPHYVIIGDPFWSVASATSLGAAQIGAADCVTKMELIIASIAAYNTANGTSIKTIIWFPPTQPEFGQDGEPRTLTSISQHQRNINLKEAAKLFASTYTTAREANKIYVCGFNVVGNPEVTARYQWAPVGPGARALISTTLGPYTDYAAMVAAASAIGDGVIIQAGTDYWVKMGAGANGGFRQATEIDGFKRRIIDSTHGCPYREMAQQVFACIKNNL